MFELDAYCVNGQATQANASVARESRPAEPPSDEREPEQREQVPEDRRRVRGRQRVPLAAPAEDEVAGQVGEVGDGAVGVAARVRALAAAVRLDAVAHLARRVRRAALRAVVLDREVAVRALAVPDPVGADHARRSRRRSRSRRARSARCGSRRGRRSPPTSTQTGQTTVPRGARSLRPIQSAAREQPDEPGIDERHRREDVAAVEEPERDREREQHEQVDVPQREQAAASRRARSGTRRRAPSQTG